MVFPIFYWFVFQVELDKPNLRLAPEVAYPNPFEGTKLAESDSIDTTEPNKGLKIEDASFGSTEVSSNNKIEANKGRDPINL